jgi:hypothetical protein
MPPAEITATSSAHVAREATSLKIGGTCALVGAVVFVIVRLLHGDTPGADAAASLTVVATRPIYAGVHIAAVFAALLILAGLISLAGTFTHPIAWALGRFGVASSLVGLAIFGVESTSEGLAIPELAAASAQASSDQQAELVRAAHAVLTVTHGPSLVAVALLFGVTLILFGASLTYDIYPSWLGWIGIMIGVATLIAATGEYLEPDLMPGFLIYGLLASVLAQVWILALAVLMLRQSKTLRLVGQRIEPDHNRPT